MNIPERSSINPVDPVDVPPRRVMHVAILMMDCGHLGCCSSRRRHRLRTRRCHSDHWSQKAPRSWLELAGQVMHSVVLTLHLALILVAASLPIGMAAAALGLVSQLGIA